MAHILLPTDFSDASMNAAHYAVTLFGRSGNRFTVLHAYVDVDVMDPALAMATADLITEANARLLEFTERFTRSTAAEGVAHELIFGALAPQVNQRVDLGGVDLIVMGREGAGSSFFGSNTVEVIKRSRVPVLVVPSSCSMVMPSTILLADDYKDVRVRDLSMLREMATRAQASLLVAHYRPWDEEEEVPWSNGVYEMALTGVPHTFVTAHGQGPVDGLERLAMQRKADMIAVLHRHIGVLERLFNPSTTKELALNARFPLLVLEQEEA